MIISPENSVANYTATQVDAPQNLTIALSSDAVQELDLPEGQVVKGTVSEDGKSITLETENGTVNLVGSFAQVSGEDVNVRVTSTETPADTEVKEGPKTEGQEPTRQSKLDQVFENTSAKVDDSADVEKLLTDLKAAIESGESSVSGELDLFADLPPVEIEFEKSDPSSFLWEAPEAREFEEAAEGSNSVDFGDGEINAGEEEWMGWDRDWETVDFNPKYKVDKSDPSNIVITKCPQLAAAWTHVLIQLPTWYEETLRKEKEKGAGVADAFEVILYYRNLCTLD